MTKPNIYALQWGILTASVLFLLFWTGPAGGDDATVQDTADLVMELLQDSLEEFGPAMDQEMLHHQVGQTLVLRTPMNRILGADKEVHQLVSQGMIGGLLLGKDMDGNAAETGISFAPFEHLHGSLATLQETAPEPLFIVLDLLGHFSPTILNAAFPTDSLVLAAMEPEMALDQMGRFLASIGVNVLLIPDSSFENPSPSQQAAPLTAHDRFLDILATDRLLFLDTLQNVGLIVALQTYSSSATKQQADPSGTAIFPGDHESGMLQVLHIPAPLLESAGLSDLEAFLAHTFRDRNAPVLSAFPLQAERQSAQLIRKSLQGLIDTDRLAPRDIRQTYSRIMEHKIALYPDESCPTCDLLP